MTHMIKDDTNNAGILPAGTFFIYDSKTAAQLYRTAEEYAENLSVMVQYYAYHDGTWHSIFLGQTKVSHILGIIQDIISHTDKPIGVTLFGGRLDYVAVLGTEGGEESFFV